MKEINSKYSECNINPKLYSEIKITNEDFNDNKQGIVYIPYQMVQRTSLDEEYVEDLERVKFMKQYSEEHECCPKCGETAHNTTLVGYILYMDKKEEYKDNNRCTCLKCGDRHTTHERVHKNKDLIDTKRKLNNIIDDNKEI